MAPTWAVEALATSLEVLFMVSRVGHRRTTGGWMGLLTIATLWLYLGVASASEKC